MQNFTSVRECRARARMARCRAATGWAASRLLTGTAPSTKGAYNRVAGPGRSVLCGFSQHRPIALRAAQGWAFVDHLPSPSTDSVVEWASCRSELYAASSTGDLQPAPSVVCSDWSVVETSTWPVRRHLGRNLSAADNAPSAAERHPQHPQARPRATFLRGRTVLGLQRKSRPINILRGTTRWDPERGTRIQARQKQNQISG